MDVFFNFNGLHYGHALDFKKIGAVVRSTLIGHNKILYSRIFQIGTTRKRSDLEWPNIWFIIPGKQKFFIVCNLKTHLLTPL